MTRIASAETPARVRLGLSLALVLTLTTLTVVAFAPGARILFAVLVGPVVTVAIAYGLPTAAWTLLLGLVVGTMVLPPTGAPFAVDPGYPAALVMYLSEGLALAIVGAIAHAALRRHSSTDDKRPGSFEGACPRRQSGRDPLTPREVEVLRLAAGGRCADELARELCLSRNTVKTHLARAYDKLGAHNRAEAVACALRDGWLEPADVAAASPAAGTHSDA